MKNRYYQLGYGGLGMFFFGAIIAIAMYLFIFPDTYRRNLARNNPTHYCRPYVEENGNIKSDAPEIMAPSYEHKIKTQPIMNTPLVPYRLVKASVPVAGYTLQNHFSKNDLRVGSSLNEVKCGGDVYNNESHSHFCQWIHPAVKVSPNLGGAPQYAVLFPANYGVGGIFGISNAYSAREDVDKIHDPYNLFISKYLPEEGAWATDDELVKRLEFGTYHIIFLAHLDEQGNWHNPKNDPERAKFPLVDVYQRVREDNHNVPVKPLPKDLINCVDINGFFLEEGYEEKPEDISFGSVMESSPDKAQEQLGWFIIDMPPLNGWYQPSCKPAVYLYPQQDTLVNVKVRINNGFFTYTDPIYPKDTGWSVLAKPNGDLFYNGNLSDSKGHVNYPIGVFPYLYYEGKINDSSVHKPNIGFVKPYNELSSFFDEVLPKLGLNAKESQEFKIYWLKALPKANYYFIGIVPQEQLNENEPLTITPKEDTMIRVRLYFEALDAFRLVEQPNITTPQRTGFTVVDWGGMVKADKNHPFTCLQ